MTQSLTPHELDPVLSIAYHEASHFVVGALFDLPIISIDMKPNAQYDAAVGTFELVKWIGDVPLRADRAAMFKLAGPSGEKRFLGRRDNSIMGHALNDLKHAEDILSAVPTRTLIAMRKHELIKQTDSLLGGETCWASVQALANALVSEPSMEVAVAMQIARIADLEASLC